MTDRKKPGVAFWATVGIVVVLVGYPLSFGPACWITSRTDVGVSSLPIVYLPLIRAMSRSERIADALDWYAQFGAAGARGDLVQSQTCAWTSSVFGKPGIAD